MSSITTRESSITRLLGAAVQWPTAWLIGLVGLMAADNGLLQVISTAHLFGESCTARDNHAGQDFTNLEYQLKEQLGIMNAAF
jgi:hypothetical protein